VATRLFSGAGDEIRLSPGGASAVPNGTFTVAAIFRKNSLTIPSSQALLAWQPNATSNYLFFGLNGSDPLLSQDGGGNVHNIQHGTLGTAYNSLAAGTWVLLAVSWNGTTGAAGSKFYGYSANSDGSWTALSGNNSAGSDTIAGWTNQGSLTGVSGSYIAVGQVEDVADLAANLALEGAWSGVLTATEVAALASSTRKTSDWWNVNTGNRPKGLWEYNGTVAAGIADVTGGGATQSAITGTTQDSTDVVGGWTYDAQGGQTAGVDAILDAQWTDVGATFQATAV
jgi:hypothetical protein